MRAANFVFGGHGQERSDRVLRDDDARRRQGDQLRLSPSGRRGRRDLSVEPAAADDLKVGLALACGNTVVVKPRKTPRTAALPAR